MRRPRAALAAALALALCGCATAPRGGGCSLPGDGPWRRYRSAHFVFDVEGDRTEPAKVVAAFEDLHAAVLAALVAEPVDVPGHVRVVVLSSDSALAAALGSQTILGVFSISRLGEPTIVVSRRAVDDVPQVVAHELAHHVSHHLFPRQPFWFGEGLAQFVEGVAKVDGEGRRWAGGESLNGWAADAVILTRAESLLAGGRSFMDSPYMTSWILYRFLWNERGPQLSEYQRRLSEGEAPDAAWRAVFPEWDPASGKAHLLDKELERHRRRGVGIRWQVTLPEVDHAYAVEPASTADVHLALLPFQLSAANPLLADRTRRSVAQEALREEPLHPLALATLAQVDGTPALAPLFESVKARPSDGRGWFLLARASDDAAERERALTRAVELWPEGARAHAALAAELARAGKAREAIREVNRALDLAPWDAQSMAVLAHVALELGKCREALVLQTRAREITEASIGTSAEDAEALRRELDAMQKRCAGAEPKPATPAAPAAPQGG